MAAVYLSQRLGVCVEMLRVDSGGLEDRSEEGLLLDIAMARVKTKLVLW